MARWLRFAPNTLGALELLAADVCAAAAARPHCLAPNDLARQFILLSRALHLFVDRARSPASLWRGRADGGSASDAGACLARTRSAPRRQRARILPSARRFVLTVARRSRFEALPPSAQTAATAVAPCASAAGRTS